MTERRCVGCGDNSHGARCEHCGVAHAPGGYEVLGIIAQAAHARLYRARDARGRIFAVKELLFALVPDIQVIEAFEREAALLRSLDHPRIPKFEAAFQEGQGVQLRLYLVQTFVDGEDLARSLERHRYTEADALAIAREVLDILVYLHGLSPPVIHRDIKPANLIRRSDGLLMLVDFDAARDLEQGVTHRATIVGTFGYMPSEQLGGTVDVTSDLYALGATLVHLLTRKPPADLFSPGRGLDFRARVNLSERFGAWLEKMCAWDRSARFPTAREALRALDLTQMPVPVAEAKANKLVVAGVLAGGTLVAVAGVGLVLATVKHLGQRTWEATPTVTVVHAPPPPPPSPPPARAPEPVEPIEPIEPPPYSSLPPTPPPSPPPPPRKLPVVSRAERVQPVGGSFKEAFVPTGTHSVSIRHPFEQGRMHFRLVRFAVGELGATGTRSVEFRSQLDVAPSSAGGELRLKVSGGGSASKPSLAGLGPGVRRSETFSVNVDGRTSAFSLELEWGDERKVLLVDLENGVARWK